MLYRCAGRPVTELPAWAPYDPVVYMGSRDEAGWAELQEEVSVWNAYDDIAANAAMDALD